MKKKDILWNENGWTTVQDADAEKHVLEISCFAKDGTVTEVRVRHNDGEEKKGEVTVDGNKVLPMALKEFKDLYLSGELTIK